MVQGSFTHSLSCTQSKHRGMHYRQGFPNKRMYGLYVDMQISFAGYHNDDVCYCTHNTYMCSCSLSSTILAG